MTDLVLTARCHVCEQQPQGDPEEWAAKIRQAARSHALDGLTAAQAGEAREIADGGGVIPTSLPGVFSVVSGDGSRTYLTTPGGHCTCPWGLRRTSADTKVCKHVGAVRLLQAAPRRSRQQLAA